MVAGETEMKELARRYAADLTGGEVLLLEGEMGAGKTVFTKGLAEGLGVLQLVTSPTYAIMNEYEGRLKVYHYDFYRIVEEAEAEELGLMEHFGDFDAVTVIEWGRNVKSYLPANSRVIRIKKLTETTREVTL